jgi:MYXO-CTERM domain-containing protein
MRAWTHFATALLLLPGPLLAAPGEPDPTFVYPAPLALEPDSTNLVRLTNGYLVVTSRLERDPGADATLELTRIDPNGARIDSFGINGSVTTLLPGPLNVATATASLADGSLLLAGFRQVGSGEDSVAAIIRLTPNGTLDTTFGDAGVVTLDVPGQLDRVAEIQPLLDGRIALVTWSRLDAPATGCWSDRTALWYLNGQGREGTEVSVLERAPVESTGCRTGVNLLADFDDQDVYRVLWGNAAGMRDGAETYVTASSGPYGPFTYFWYYPTYYSVVRGDAFELRGGSTPSPAGAYVHANLAVAAGFDGPITWTQMRLDGGRAIVAGFSTAGGQAAVVRMAVDGHLDTSWGAGNGVAVVTGAGRSGVLAPGGLAKDIRYLGATDAGVVIATADGVIQRLQSGTTPLGGIISLTVSHPSYSRVLGTVPVRVARSGDTLGAVTVQYEVLASSCGPPVTCRDDYSPAQPNQDFVPQRGQLSWADGEGGDKTIVVTIFDQAFAQPNETFAVRIFDATGTARIANDTVVVLLESRGEGLSPGTGNSTGGGGGGGGGGMGWAALLLLGGLATRSRRR